MAYPSTRDQAIEQGHNTDHSGHHRKETKFHTLLNQSADDTRSQKKTRDDSLGEVGTTAAVVGE